MRLLTQQVARCVLQLAGTLLTAAGPVPDASAGPAPDAFAESSRESRSKELVETLRRQLMRDNSDYSLEAPGTAPSRADSELDALPLVVRHLVDGHPTFGDSRRPDAAGTC